MRFSLFIARRISYQSRRTFSKIITRIAFISIVLSIAIMLAADAIVIGFQSEIKNKFSGFASHIVVSKTKTNFAWQVEPILRDDGLKKSIAQIPGVVHIQPGGLKLGILKSENENEGVILKGVAPNFYWNFYKDKFLEGGKITLTYSVASNEICVPLALAKKLNLKLNQKVRMFFLFEKSNDILNRVFIIKGIFETGVEEIDKRYILADLRQVQQLNGWAENQYGGYEVFLSGFKHINTINDKIYELVDARNYLSTRTIMERYPQIFDWLGLLDLNVFVILTLMTMVGAINMITALLVMILERTQMIGTLKAIGANGNSIMKIFIINSMIIIGAGLIVGNIIGLGFLAVQHFTHLIKLPQESYYLSYVPVHFSFLRILSINTGAFVCCTLSMVLPALLVLRIKPARALRFE